MRRTSDDANVNLVTFICHLVWKLGGLLKMLSFFGGNYFVEIAALVK